MILINLLGNVAILLWATRMVRLGVIRFLGYKLPAMIEATSRSKLRATISGILIASMVQSSSATSVLVSSFAKDGVLSIAMAIAIILGADVGSTLMLQVLSFNISWLSPVMFLLGYVIFQNDDTHKSELGRAFMGIGLMILSLHLMSVTMQPLQTNDIFKTILQIVSDQIWLTILIISLSTWFMHSSIAMVLIIIGLAINNTIDLELALTMVLSANMGAAIIPIALTAKSSPDCRRIPLGVFIIRVTGALLLFPFIPLMTEFLKQNIESIGVQIALFHTFFNVLMLFIGLPLIDIVAGFTKRIFKNSEVKNDLGATLLKKENLKTISIAISTAEREVINQTQYIEKMLTDIIKLVKDGTHYKVKELRKLDDYVDSLYHDIKLYAAEISRSELTKEEAERTMDIISYTTNLEHVGDIIDVSMLDLVEKKIESDAVFSEKGWRDIKKIHAIVLNQLYLSIDVFMKGKVEDAKQLLRGKKDMQKLESEAITKHFSRLKLGIKESVHSSSIHLDIIRDLKRIDSHLRSVAYPILEKHGELNSDLFKNHK